MTEYTDVPQAHMLHQESEQITQAIYSIDNGGSLASIAIAPPPYDPSAPMPSPMMMTVSIPTPPPTDPTLLAQIRVSLVQRQTDIAAELEALGVTSAPPAREGVA